MSYDAVIWHLLSCDIYTVLNCCYICHTKLKIQADIQFVFVYMYSQIQAHMDLQDYWCNSNHDADGTAITIPARDLHEGSKHITWSRRRPLVCSDVELRPRTTNGSLAPKGRAAGGSSRAGVGPQLPRLAHGLQSRADPFGSGGRRCVAGHAARSR